MIGKYDSLKADSSNEIILVFAVGDGAEAEIGVLLLMLPVPEVVLQLGPLDPLPAPGTIVFLWPRSRWLVSSSLPLFQLKEEVHNWIGK